MKSSFILLNYDNAISEILVKVLRIVITKLNVSVMRCVLPSPVSYKLLLTENTFSNGQFLKISSNAN